MEDALRSLASSIAFVMAHYDITYLLMFGKPKNELEQLRYDNYLRKTRILIEKVFMAAVQDDKQGIKNATEELFNYVDSTLTI